MKRSLIVCLVVTVLSVCTVAYPSVPVRITRIPKKDLPKLLTDEDTVSLGGKYYFKPTSIGVRLQRTIVQYHGGDPLQLSG